LFELKTECIPYRKRITNKFNEKFIVFIPKAAPGSRVSKYEVDFIYIFIIKSPIIFRSIHNL
jgi:hypothetical protein